MIGQVSSFSVIAPRKTVRLFDSARLPTKFNARRYEYTGTYNPVEAHAHKYQYTHIRYTLKHTHTRTSRTASSTSHRTVAPTSAHVYPPRTPHPKCGSWVTCSPSLIHPRHCGSYSKHSGARPLRCNSQTIYRENHRCVRTEQQDSSSSEMCGRITRLRYNTEENTPPSNEFTIGLFSATGRDLRRLR